MCVLRVSRRTAQLPRLTSHLDRVAVIDFPFLLFLFNIYIYITPRCTEYKFDLTSARNGGIFDVYMYTIYHLRHYMPRISRRYLQKDLPVTSGRT